MSLFGRVIELQEEAEAAEALAGNIPDDVLEGIAGPEAQQAALGEHRAAGIEDSGLASEIASNWNIVRNYDFEDNSSRMTFEGFANEWTAAGIGRSPTQEEYVNWMEWGSPGTLFAQMSPNSTSQTDVDMQQYLLDLGVDTDIASGFSGIRADIYGEDALGYINSIESGFDPVNDGQYVLVPRGTQMRGSSDYVSVTDIGDHTLYMNQENEQWYEEEWVTYAALAASIVAFPYAAQFGAQFLGSLVGGAIAGSAAGSIALGAAGGVLAGGVQSGIMAELAGGDFMEGITAEGAVSSAISGGIGRGATLFNVDSGGTLAALQAGGSIAGDVLTGQDIDFAGAGAAAIGGLSEGDIAPAIASYSAARINGATDEQALVQGGMSYLSGLMSSDEDRTAIGIDPDTGNPIFAPTLEELQGRARNSSLHAMSQSNNSRINSGNGRRPRRKSFTDASFNSLVRPSRSAFGRSAITGVA